MDRSWSLRGAKAGISMPRKLLGTAPIKLLLLFRLKGDLGVLMKLDARGFASDFLLVGRFLTTGGELGKLAMSGSMVGCLSSADRLRASFALTNTGVVRMEGDSSRTIFFVLDFLRIGRVLVQTLLLFELVGIVGRFLLRRGDESAADFCGETGGVKGCGASNSSVCPFSIDCEGVRTHVGLAVSSCAASRSCSASCKANFSDSLLASLHFLRSFSRSMAP